MPTELEELVEFLHHGNADIRKVAIENLVGFSKAQPAIFKKPQLQPIKDLKLLARDYPPIPQHALTILINLSEDEEVLKSLAEDNDFLETLLMRVTNITEPNADDIATLLANLAKSDKLLRLLTLKRQVPKDLSTSEHAIDQLMDCFVKGAAGGYNKNADYDYLAYFFADMAKHEDVQKYLTAPQSRDNDIIPLSKLTVFTEHSSHIRRRGVASTLKNVCFHVPSHTSLMSTSSINIMPYILLPLAGSEEYPDDEMETMLEDLQLLPPDKERESDVEIVKTHLESLLLLTSTREGREWMREHGVYPVVRETHLHVEDEGVREACDRVVQMIKGTEEGEEDGETPKIQEIAEDEEDQLIDVA